MKYSFPEANFRISLEMDYRIITFDSKNVTIFMRDFYVKAHFNRRKSFLRKNVGQSCMLLPCLAYTYDEVYSRTAKVMFDKLKVDEVGIDFQEVLQKASDIVRDLPKIDKTFNFDEVFKGWEKVQI